MSETIRARAHVIDALQSLGDRVEIPVAQGAFYFLIRPRSKMNAMRMVEHLVNKHRVAVIPGTGFGVHEDCALRISYGALTAETAAEGMSRLVSGLKELI
jgi:aspartate/methionine/tyrosine aminotransferase